MKPILALALTSLVATALEAQQLTMDLIFGESGEQRPTALSWAPDGRTLGYLWSDGEGRAFWTLDAAGGTARARLRLADLEAQVEGFSIDAYHWMEGGESLLVEFSGDLFVVGLESGALRRLTETEAEESDPKVSPAGDVVAFVRGEDLWAIDLESGAERRLTRGGEENVLLNGRTDWVYWEELWGRDSTGYWWSGDGERIAYYQFDETPVGEYALVDFTPRYPEVEWMKYPKAGQTNPLVRVGVLDLASGETVWMETGDPVEWYLPRVDWLPDGRLAVQRLNRDQSRLELLRCEATAGECSVWLAEERPTWVDVNDEYRFLDDGRLVWLSERSGWAQLYLIDAGGRIVGPITAADGAVTSLAGIDHQGRLVYQAYSGPPLGALSREIWRVGLDGEGAERLSRTGGWSSASMAEGGRYFLETSSAADTAPAWRVRETDGRTVAELPYEPVAFDASALPRREFFTIEDAEGRDLPASIVKPAGLDPAKRYPAIMYHYGGPESQVVRDAWSVGSRELWTRMMAERGYVMFSVDNPGSSYFGQEGADALHRRFGEVNLAAQRAGVEYLESLGWVDGERIGLWGWSGGGSNTLYSILNAPGTWRAAVSGAPVTDWHLYDTIWTERYLDHPDDNPEGYRDSSAVTHAANLADALLLVHGTADDNVHPQNSLVMTKALVDAGVPFDLAIYPREKHGLRGKSSRHFYEKMTAFFERELAERAVEVEGEGEPRG